MQTDLVPVVVSAMIYQTARQHPSQVFPKPVFRYPEIFIPSASVYFTLKTLNNQFACHANYCLDPRNIYPIAVTPVEHQFSTRPLEEYIYAQSPVLPVTLPQKFVQSVTKLAGLQRKLLQKSITQKERQEYFALSQALVKQMDVQCFESIAGLHPSVYERCFSRPKPICPVQDLPQAGMDERGITYARMRSPTGLRLYEASSTEARQAFDTLRASIQLSQEDDEQLQLSFANLFHHSKEDIKRAYEAADKAVQQHPQDEALKKAKREAYIRLYENSTPEAQRLMDVAYFCCYETFYYEFEQQMTHAMMNLYLSAPIEEQRAYDTAWS